MARSSTGLPRSGDPSGTAAIQAYVIAQAHREPSWLESAAAWLSERGACVPAAWLAD